MQFLPSPTVIRSLVSLLESSTTPEFFEYLHKEERNTALFTALHDSVQDDVSPTVNIVILIDLLLTVQLLI